MTEINIPNDYPVELDAPDISPYRNGNTDIPYIWRFDSGKAGPNVMISAVVHGNEPCGAIALDWLLKKDIRPQAGSLSLAFMNIAAYEAFDPADPNATRWVEEDFNRVWEIDVLEGERDSVELRRAREVRPALTGIDFLLDIHSMQHLAPPLMMTGRHARAKRLAASVGVPDRVVGDAGHAAGRRMRDYAAFDDPDASQTALLIECGQHWEASAGDLARESAARFLVATGVAAPDLLEEFPASVAEQSAFTVIEAVTIQSDAFVFAEPFSGGEIIARKGTLLGHDGEREVVTPEDDIMLVMPSKRLWRGQTAVRLARRDAP
ncbi:succinylglutamate desuccinylase/aspartoacylase family protein [Labrenzia sp. VG12]|uniref:succinylglutamate desuccinylase/aspartoacylase domain-containing protein n=1 Tax=Labrenzia sp. VG12 TaxID=2021862 RepID=UPI000B8BFA41|nr:succinylglutamate desuccinylase/aspartoacylase family protein [Labrenzia sp. VG12]ASP36316.1 succinylglutamate desuccinylase [Labrenzia sp. VG12]